MSYYKNSLFYRIDSNALIRTYNYLSDSPALTTLIINELKSKYSIFDLSLMACDYIYKSNFNSWEKPFSINALLDLFN